MSRNSERVDEAYNICKYKDVVDRYNSIAENLNNASKLSFSVTESDNQEFFGDFEASLENMHQPNYETSEISSLLCLFLLYEDLINDRGSIKDEKLIDGAVTQELDKSIMKYSRYVNELKNNKSTLLNLDKTKLQNKIFDLNDNIRVLQKKLDETAKFFEEC